MRWLGRRTVALCLALIALIGGMVGYTRAGPNPLHTYGLDTCAGAPCFMGIAPGTTPWNDARTKAAQHGYDTPDRTHLVLSMGDALFSVVTYQDEAASPVQSIFGRNPSDGAFPHLGSFLTQYGMPCGVAIGDQPGLLELRYPSLDLNVFIGNQDSVDGLTANSPVVYMSLISQTPGMCASEHLCSAILPWLGFRSLDYYRAHGLPLSRRACDFPGQ